jgi:hypothetical protein
MKFERVYYLKILGRPIFRDKCLSHSDTRTIAAVKIRAISSPHRIRIAAI